MSIAGGICSVIARREKKNQRILVNLHVPLNEIKTYVTSVLYYTQAHKLRIRRALLVLEACAMVYYLPQPVCSRENANVVCLNKNLLICAIFVKRMNDA